jgi:peptidoglycan/xylan/chitin deacetylase (PgdA/CDA1 family)
LTFDFDALSSWIAWGLVTPTPLSRGEFGAIGTGRILSLLKKFDIRATWFIPGVTIKTYPEVCEGIVEQGHEIAHHGWTHVPPANLSREKELEGLIRGNEAISRLSGRPARGYRSPAWDLSSHTVELLLDQGFLYDSSMMGNDYTPYYARIGDAARLEGPFKFGKTTNLLEMPISWSTDDFPHFEYVPTANTFSRGLKSTNAVLAN